MSNSTFCLRLKNLSCNVAAVLIPGILLSILLIITVIIQVKLNPSLTPGTRRTSWGERATALKDLLPWIGSILLVLGVIFGGIMTPTEAASLGALLSIGLALGYRRMSLTALKESMWTAVKITSMCAFIIFTATALGIVFNQIGLIHEVADFMLELPFGKYAIIAIIGATYLVLGMFIEDWTMMLLTLPFVLPVVTGLGFSSLWFGVWYVMVGEIGLITPPFGLNLFVLHSVVPKYDVLTIALGALPFIIPMLVMAVILVVFPQLALWLPSILY